MVYIFETYLDLRQLQALKRPSLPPQLKGIVSEEKFEKSKAYQLDKRYATSCTSVWRTFQFDQCNHNLLVTWNEGGEARLSMF